MRRVSSRCREHTRMGGGLTRGGGLLICRWSRKARYCDSSRHPVRPQATSLPCPMNETRIAKLKALLETDPTDTFCLYGLAQEYEKGEDLETAIAYYDQTLAADADYFYAYYFKGRALAAQGAVDAARDVIREGLRRAEQAQDAKAAGELTELLETM